MGVRFDVLMDLLICNCSGTQKVDKEEILIASAESKEGGLALIKRLIKEYRNGIRLPPYPLGSVYSLTLYVIDDVMPCYRKALARAKSVVVMNNGKFDN